MVANAGGEVDGTKLRGPAHLELLGEPPAMIAEGLTTRAGAPVHRLEVVALGARSVVVVYVLLDEVERRGRHAGFL